MTEPTDSAPTGIDVEELEAQAGEELPDREAMSLIALDDGLVMAPPEEGPMPPQEQDPVEPDKGPQPMEPHPRYDT